MGHIGRIRLLAFSGLALVALTLAACGTSPQPPAGRSNTQAGGVEATGTPGTPAGEMVATGAPGTPGQVTGRVDVEVDKALYAPTDTIHVRIHNGSATAIFAYAYYTNCTMAELELSINGAWVPQGRCIRIAPTNGFVQVQLGTTMQELRPLTGQFSAGTYRIAFPYTTDADPDSGPSAVVYSASFIIG